MSAEAAEVESGRSCWHEDDEVVVFVEVVVVEEVVVEATEDSSMVSSLPLGEYSLLS